MPAHLPMIGLARRNEAPQPTEISSRLLPQMLDPAKLERAAPFTVLDFGRAHASTLNFFADHSCRFQVLDAAPALLKWRSALDPEAETGQMVDAFEGLFRELDSLRFDLVFLWDTLNLLPDRALPAFFRFLAYHVHDGFTGHGFMLQKRDAQAPQRDCAIVDAGTIRITEQQPGEQFIHNRKTVNEAMPPMQIKHGVLHGDGRLEFLFNHTSI
jgi:hypothetical protein